MNKVPAVQRREMPYPDRGSCRKLIFAATIAGWLFPLEASVWATSLGDFGNMAWDVDSRGEAFAPSGWTLTYSDSFLYDANLSKFVDQGTAAAAGLWYLPGHANYGIGSFQRPANPEYHNTFLSLTNGGLKLRAHRNPLPSTTWYTAGMASVNTSGQGFAQKYGYFEITAQLPVATGSQTKYCAWPAFWLLSQNGFDPARTANRVEIDALEWYSNDTGGHHGTVHLIDAANVRQSIGSYHDFGFNLSSSPHTFGVEITPALVRTFLDRQEIARFPSVPEFANPMYVLVNNAIDAPPGTIPDLGETEWNYIIQNVSVYAMPTEVILDNTASSGVAINGTWTPSTSGPGFYGTNYIHDGGTDKGLKSVTYTPQLPCDGTYEVYGRWTSGSNRATNTPFIVDGPEGTQVVNKNQTVDGKQWIYLTTAYFTQGSDGSVTISNTGTAAGKVVIADAVKFTLLDPWERIVDNSDSSHVVQTGIWAASTDTTDFYGTNYLQDGGTNKGSSSVKFNVTLPQSGAYEAFVRWSAGANRSSNVPIDIFTADGTVPLSVDERTDGGEWVSLGVYTFDSAAGGGILISNTGTAPGSYVVADAVKFSKVAPTPEIVMDDADGSGITRTGTWTSSTSGSGYYGTDYIHDDATDKGLKSVRFTPNLPYAGTYEVFTRWTAAANRAPNIPLQVIGADGTANTSINEQTNGQKWISLGLFRFAAGTGGSVLISNSGTPAGKYVIVDAVKFDYKK